MNPEIEIYDLANSCKSIAAFRKKIKQFVIQKTTDKVELFIMDRSRSVNYNGVEITANHYKCSACKEDYLFQETKHNFCPNCGSKYQETVDVSF